MTGLKHRSPRTDIRRRRHPHAPHKRSGKVTKNVPEHVFRYQHIKALRTTHQKQGCRIDVHTLRAHFRILLSHLVEEFAKKHHRRQHVGLIDQRHQSTPLPSQQKSIMKQPQAATSRHQQTVGHFVGGKRSSLQPRRKQTFSALTQNDKINVARTHALQRAISRMIQPRRTFAPVQFKVLPDVDLRCELPATGPANIRQTHGPQQHGIGRPAGLQSRLRQRLTAPLKFSCPRRKCLAAELQPGIAQAKRVQHLQR